MKWSSALKIEASSSWNVISNGARWHVRAWCEKNADFRDFTLSRIAEVEWSREEAEPPTEDKDWNDWVTLRASPHRSLSEEQRKTVERDYAMLNGVLQLKVRKAMEGYGHSPTGSRPVRMPALSWTATIMCCSTRPNHPASV